MEADSPEVRKTVTVLFVDLIDSVPLGERLDPEVLRKIVARFFNEMAAVIERHGGRVENVAGDAVTGVFGLQEAREDDALRAVRAAADMRVALDELNDEIGERWNERLQGRIGINTGEILAGPRVEGRSVLVGDAVNLAARLQQTGGADEVLLGPATYELVRHAVDVDHRRIVLKGKSDEVDAFLLRNVLRDSPGIPRRLEIPLVGRKDELRTLTSAIANVEHRPSGLGLVIGNPGVGKSRLIAELATIEGLPSIVVGQCAPRGDKDPYDPLSEVAAAAERHGGGDDAGLTSFPSSAIDELVGRAERHSPPEELYWAAGMLLERAGRAHGLVVIFEDVHWAEPPVIGFIDHLMGSERRGVFVLCTARPELLHERPEWTSRARPLVRLGPLGEGDEEALLEMLLGDRCSQEIVDLVHQRAGGNPLFIEQLTSFGLDTDPSRLHEVPASIRALLTSRIDGLDAGTRNVLEAAAVLGSDFTAGELTSLLPELARSEIEGATRQLVDRDFLAPPSAPDADGFGFRHDLIRDVAYDRIPRGRRSEMHVRRADSLRVGRGNDGLIGYHEEQAFIELTQLGPIDDELKSLARRAGQSLARAGFAAHSRLDMEIAADLLERARRLYEAAEEFPIGVLRRLNDALIDLDEPVGNDGSRVFFEAAANSTGDARFSIETQLCDLVSDARNPQYPEAEVVARIDRIIDSFRRLGDDEGTMRATNYAAHHYAVSGREHQALVMTGEVIKIARTMDNAFEELWARRRVVSSLTWGPYPLSEALTEATDLLEWTNALPSTTGTYIALSLLATIEGHLGKLHEARKRMARAADIVEGVLPRFGPHVGFSVFDVEVPFGDLNSAESSLIKWRDLLIAHESPGVAASLTARLAALWRLQGRWLEAERAIADARSSTADDDHDVHLMCDAVDAYCRLERGDAKGAETVARRGVDRAEQTDSWTAQGWALLSLAQSLRERDRAQSMAVARQAEERFRLKEHRVGIRVVGDLLETTRTV